MDKYRLFDKVAKCKACTFYKAQSNSKRQKVIVKKIHKGTSWQQILKAKQLSLCKSDNKYFPKVLEMVKDEERFYAILEPLEENLQTVIHNNISKEDILKISKLLIQMAINFWQNKIIPKQLRPSYIFLNNNRHTIKLAYFENALAKDIAKMDLVELQDMKYLSPQQVLTSKEIDERATIFSIGLIIYQLITGKSLLKANTKINYMYEICQLFPQQKAQNLQAVNSTSRINQLQSSKLHENISKLGQSNIATPQTFEKALQQQQISNQFIALIRQMLRIDRSQRLTFENLMQSFQIIAEHEQEFQKNKHLSESKAKFMNKPHGNQVDINNQILQETVFDFETKPTLSTMPIIKNTVGILPTQKNVEDDAVQPIIIKQSSKPLDEAGNLMVNTLPIGFNKPIGSSKQQLQTTKDTAQSRGTNNYSFSSVRRPQLTNYAMNEANLGVQVGLNPTIFSDNDV